MKAKDQISVDRLRKLFDYDPETGKLCWSNAACNVHKGRLAGSVSKGYLRVEIDGNSLYVHRVVWAIYYGEYPKTPIRHKDGNKLKNNISNLLVCTKRECQMNLERHRNGKLVGATYDPRTKRWVSRYSTGYKKNRKTTYVGSFRTSLLAHKAYLEATSKVQS